MERARVLWAMLCLGVTLAVLAGRSLRQFILGGGGGPGRKRSPRMPTGTHVGSYGNKEHQLQRERHHELREAAREKRQIGYLKRELKPKHKSTPALLKTTTRKEIAAGKALALPNRRHRTCVDGSTPERAGSP